MSPQPCPSQLKGIKPGKERSVPSSQALVAVCGEDVIGPVRAVTESLTSRTWMFGWCSVEWLVVYSLGWLPPQPTAGRGR